MLDWLEDIEDLIGVLLIENPYRYNPLIDGLDSLLLAIVEQDGAERNTRHVKSEHERVQIRVITHALLREWIAGVQNRSIIPWIVQGEILYDRDGELARIKQQVIAFPEELRKQKLAAEFSVFLRTFLQAKQDLQNGNVLDANSSVLTALHHWAHISLIEDGVHPELTVWAQMKRYNPGIYKLYEELTTSTESLEKRVQLVLLACEFHVISKMKSCCRLLLDIIESREEPWSVAELLAHPELQSLRLDMSLLLRKLVKRGLICEAADVPDSGSANGIEAKYAAVRENI